MLDFWNKRQYFSLSVLEVVFDVCGRDDALSSLMVQFPVRAAPLSFA